MTSEITDQIVELYKAMPGAVMPPKHNGDYFWGEVENTEHWAFCRAIVVMMRKNAAEAATVALSVMQGETAQ